MILTCPECATSYSVPDTAVGAKGRRVRCQSCAHVWTATPPEEPLDLTAAATPKPAPESLAETPAPELPRAYRARAEQQRRIRRAAAHGAVWASLAGAFVAILGAAWLFRVEVVEVFPRAAAAYAAVGAPVNPVGLEFEALTARPAPNNPEMVLVSGALRNIRDREITAPPIRVALLDEHGAEIGHQLLRIRAAPVLPGGVQGFAALIPDPGGEAADVGVDFSQAQTAAPASDPHATAPQPAEAEADTAHDPAPAPRPLPAADTQTAGLRPAMHADPGPPIDVATPAAGGAAGGLRPLDSATAEALSASHHG